MSSDAAVALPMVPVGSSGVQVTRLVFGGAPIGGLFAPVDDDAAQATLEAAWDAGIRAFDTAPHYGVGLSERRIGRFLAGRPRGDYVLSTKVGRSCSSRPMAMSTAPRATSARRGWPGFATIHETACSHPWRQASGGSESTGSTSR